MARENTPKDDPALSELSGTGLPGDPELDDPSFSTVKMNESALSETLKAAPAQPRARATVGSADLRKRAMEEAVQKAKSQARASEPEDAESAAGSTMKLRRKSGAKPAREPEPPADLEAISGSTLKIRRKSLDKAVQNLSAAQEPEPLPRNDLKITLLLASVGLLIGAGIVVAVYLFAFQNEPPPAPASAPTSMVSESLPVSAPAMTLPTSEPASAPVEKKKKKKRGTTSTKRTR